MIHCEGASHGGGVIGMVGGFGVGRDGGFVVGKEGAKGGD